jgi:hypothetical protein
MKLRHLLINGLLLVPFSSFCQKDTSTHNKADKADVLIQKNVIYDKSDVKKTDSKPQIKQRTHTSQIKIKHKRHKKKRKIHILKK